MQYMKKIYMTPAVEITEVVVEQMLALSLNNKPADPNEDVLTKENNDWDIWGE